MNVVRTQFGTLAGLMQGASSGDLVEIQENGGMTYIGTFPFSVRAIVCRVKRLIRAFLPQLGLFSKMAPYAKNNSTLTYLAKAFGANRLQRILDRSCLALDTTSALRKDELEHILPQAAEVFVEDLQELLDEIHSGSQTVRALSTDETTILRQEFSGITSVDQCTNGQLDRLFEMLIPFSEIRHLFFNKVPEIDHKVLDCGKFLQGMQGRVYLYENFRRTSHTEPQWSMTLAKRLIDREMPTNVVFKNPHGGYCKVHETVAGGGSFKCFLKQMGQASMPNVVLYRGMRPMPLASESVSSLIEVFRKNLGSAGPKQTFARTKALLEDPAHGFIHAADDKVLGIGMSLGACHLQRDLAQFIDRFRTITVIGGPGQDTSSVQQFARAVNSLDTAPSMRLYWDADDIVPQFGPGHMGAGCDPKKMDIEINILSLKGGALDTHREARRHPGGLISALSKYLKSSTDAHTRNTLSMPHHVFRISNQTEPDLVNKILNHETFIDPRWEQMRRTFSPL